MDPQQEGVLVNIDEVSRFINIQRPYFAFLQLRHYKDALIGSFRAEQPMVYEAGPITAGELGRHLAILGSSAAVALRDGPEGYYLATNARFTRKPAHLSSYQDMFHASAQVLSINKRTLKTFAKAWGAEPLAELECEYAILKPAVFERSFKDYASDDLHAAQESPYRISIPLHHRIWRKGSLDASAGPLSSSQCAGHFSHYPCWPVAIISQTAFEVTGELLKKNYGDSTRFHVMHTKLSAERLVGANTTLRFNTEITEESVPLIIPLLIKSITRVYRASEEVAKLTSILELNFS